MLSQYEMYLCILSQEHEDVKMLWKLAIDARLKFEKYDQRAERLRYIGVRDRIQRITLKLKLREQRRYKALEIIVKLLKDNEIYKSC